jgi:hypothetical protein
MSAASFPGSIGAELQPPMPNFLLFSLLNYTVQRKFFGSLQDSFHLLFLTPYSSIPVFHLPINTQILVSNAAQSAVNYLGFYAIQTGVLA